MEDISFFCAFSIILLGFKTMATDLSFVSSALDHLKMGPLLYQRYVLSYDICVCA